MRRDSAQFENRLLAFMRSTLPGTATAASATASSPAPLSPSLAPRAASAPAPRTAEMVVPATSSASGAAPPLVASVATSAGLADLLNLTIDTGSLDVTAASAAGPVAQSPPSQQQQQLLHSSPLQAPSSAVPATSPAPATTAAGAPPTTTTTAATPPAPLSTSPTGRSDYPHGLPTMDEAHLIGSSSYAPPARSESSFGANIGALPGSPSKADASTGGGSAGGDAEATALSPAAGARALLDTSALNSIAADWPSPPLPAPPPRAATPLPPQPLVSVPVPQPLPAPAMPPPPELPPVSRLSRSLGAWARMLRAAVDGARGAAPGSAALAAAVEAQSLAVGGFLRSLRADLAARGWDEKAGAWAPGVVLAARQGEGEEGHGEEEDTSEWDGDVAEGGGARRAPSLGLR